jgi:hypothetical protein
VAAQKENHRMTHFLLSLGACPLAKDVRGKRPLDYVHLFPNSSPKALITFGLLEKFRL